MTAGASEQCSPKTNAGSLYACIKRANEAGNLAFIHATAAKLGYVGLRDAPGDPARDRGDWTRNASSQRRCAGETGWRSRHRISRWPSWPARSSHSTCCPTRTRERTRLALADRVRPPTPSPRFASPRRWRRAGLALTLLVCVGVWALSAMTERLTASARPAPRSGRAAEGDPWPPQSGPGPGMVSTPTRGGASSHQGSLAVGSVYCQARRTADARFPREGKSR